MIIGTAGHIDHGKSALVRVLTGRSMDRLAEERRRGITIDLNFAPLDLGDGVMAGVVDVPGHEDFVRTMVAGASGIDLVLLVIAADEGIMPQTEEHLAILEYLGVTSGIPVIAKADLAEPEWLELLELEVTERLARSSVDFSAPAVVSIKTEQGLSSLRERLRAAAAAAKPRPVGDVFRLPIDRAFSIAGAGTVVTGTAWSGQIRVGDHVTVLPRGERSRVRSVESFGHAVTQSEPGARTALGLVDIERTKLQRGDVAVSDTVPWSTTTALDVELAVHPSATRPIVSRSRVRVHLGTAEIMARVLPRQPIAPGEAGLARLSLEQPTVARGGDRFVLRSFSPVTTIGGGRVLDPSPPRRPTAWPGELASADPAVRLRVLFRRRPAGVDSAALPLLLGMSPRAAQAVATTEPALRQVGTRWVEQAVLEALARRAINVVRDHHRRHKSDPGMALETLRHSLRAPDWQIDAVLVDLTETRQLRQANGTGALPGFAPQVDGGAATIDQLVALLEQADLTPPSIGELERQTHLPNVAAALRLAAAAGRVEAVERDRYYSRGALDRFAETLRQLGRDGLIVPGAVRDRLGLSRKFLIPLLEWADARGLTVRVADGRQLRH